MHYKDEFGRLRLSWRTSIDTRLLAIQYFGLVSTYIMICYSSSCFQQDHYDGECTSGPWVSIILFGRWCVEDAAPSSITAIF